jgi:proteasome lid subunit RPN8/RPN11
MTVTLVIPESISIELDRSARLPVETAGVLTARLLDEDASSLRLLARELHWVPESAYLRREADGLTIASDGYVPALGRAEQDGATAIWVHTHPGLESWPKPSPHDRVVDGQLRELFWLRTNSKCYGALILSPRNKGLTFTGHVDVELGERLAIDRLWIVGDRLRLYRSFDSPHAGLSPSFDRNVRAFGTAIQETLADLQVGIVGAAHRFCCR